MKAVLSNLSSIITGFLGGAFLCMLILLSSAFTVHEGQRAVIMRLGQLKTDLNSRPIICEPGLHFRIPFLESPYYIDIRQQIWIMDSDPIQTIDQLYLLVDFYFKWEVSDSAEFFRIHTAGGTRSWDAAKSNVEFLLKQRVKNAVLEEFGRRPLGRLVLEDRRDIMETFGAGLSNSLKDLAVKLVDLRLKKIELPDDVSEKVYNRMRTEREKSATMLRASGLEQSEKIRAQADFDVKMILSKVQSDALKMKGQVDAEIMKMYAEAFADQVAFYELMRSCEMTREVFQSPDNILIVRPEKVFPGIYKREHIQ
ncbi:MAG: protease modulator HflC [Gammaproteobacteria bacterium]|nr:protease modulator HflC [Gammaproteobacteria bacterium]